MDDEVKAGAPGVADRPGEPDAARQEPAVVSKEQKDKKKKKKKARDAWISFAGRIVAQIVGAVATIMLGLYVVSRSNLTREAHPQPEAVAPARSVRSAGDMATIAVLPLQNFSGDSRQDYFADGMTEALIAHLAQVKGRVNGWPAPTAALISRAISVARSAWSARTSPTLRS